MIHKEGFLLYIKMKNTLKIKDKYLSIGITNTFLAEKAGITPAELFELDQEVSSRKVMFNRIMGVIHNEKKSSLLPHV